MTDNDLKGVGIAAGAEIINGKCVAEAVDIATLNPGTAPNILAKIVEYEMMITRQIIFISVWVLMLLSACSPLEAFIQDPLPETTNFVAEGIDNPRIQFLWLELPSQIEPGSANVRVFLAKTDPPEPIIPNPNELQCKLSSANDYFFLGPEKIPFEFKEDGTFIGSYTYKACPECIECYMNWDYTLDISGLISPETVSIDIAIKHMGHNVQGSFVSAELSSASDTTKEPRISCNQTIDCEQIKFVTKE